MKPIIKRNGQRGFTLVEVIVVAVIVAVLAGVSIPLYNGYVDNSRANQAANIAGSVASFMGACYQNPGAIPENVADEGVEFTTTTEYDPNAPTTTSLRCVIEGAASNPSIQIPQGYIVRRDGATILARYHEVGAGDAGESPPFTFPVPTAAGGDDDDDDAPPPPPPPAD